MLMQTILCFGDSNTWGYNPVDGSRFGFATRWPGVLEQALGSINCRIIEEGLNGRTTVHNEAERPMRSGRDILPVLLEAHRPLDWVVIMLGTNDLKTHFNSSAEEIAQNLGALCDVVLQNEYLAEHRPQILLCAPTSANEISQELPEWFVGASESARDLPRLIEREAHNRGVLFLNVAGLLDHDFKDSLHWMSAQHLTVGRAIAAVIAGSTAA
jgi:lysophospholipase L1-like esterase